MPGAGSTGEMRGFASPMGRCVAYFPRVETIEAPDRSALYRRTLAVVVVSQVFGGAGLAAGVTVGALLAADLLGGAGAAGVPAALFTLGSALTAYAVGRVSQRAGRRRGLSGGFLAGAVGAAGIVVAATIESPALLFASLFVYGAGTATNLQARYAGTDLATPQNRGTAVSVALVATTFGAVAGPNTVGLTGDLATSIGIPALAGPFLLAAVGLRPCRRGGVGLAAPRPVARGAGGRPGAAPGGGPAGPRPGEPRGRGRGDGHGADAGRDGGDHDDDAGAHAGA